MTDTRKPQSADKYIVRLPDGMRERIKVAADEYGRSMNAQIVYMLQSYFDHLDGQVAELTESLETERQEGISIGLADPLDRIAVLKVLLLDELMLLRRRVSQVGGREAVLKAPKSELVKSIEGPRIEGTSDERASYFSKIVGNTPLTALLTDDEIAKIAQRVVTLQAEQERLIASARVAEREPERAVDIRGSSGKVQRSIVTTKRNRLG